MTAGRLPGCVHGCVRHAGASRNPTPSSFMDRKSCMRREGRMPVAAQRRLESSGLDHPFPPSGNDNHRNDNRIRHPLKPAIPSPAGLPCLDSGLRRHDDTGLWAGHARVSNSLILNCGRIVNYHLPHRHSGAGPPTGMYACMDAGGRAVSGTSRRGSLVGGERRRISVRPCQFDPMSSLRPFPRCGNDLCQPPCLRQAGWNDGFF